MQPERLPSPLLRVLRGYVTITETLLITGMAGVVLLAALQVFFRYVVGASLSWSEEALRYLMIWIAFLGIGLAYARGEMIGMELLTSALPPRLGKTVGLAGRALILAMMIAIAIYGWQFAWKTRAGTATAIPISMFWVHIAVAVGAVLVGLHVIAGAVAVLLGLDEDTNPAPLSHDPHSPDHPMTEAPR
ncbi:TRAP transporter small permease [Pseudooceanicola aestuarii]|uniref:TRAP transporter small permease n=1 Tax=Pseudooceanicola aestuarii TaxID=2697319 RepID=UPI0013D833E6|nr:TRAP transporter small permease [Pseudooceanicola aestuarii]